MDGISFASAWSDTGMVLSPLEAAINDVDFAV